MDLKINPNKTIFSAKRKRGPRRSRAPGRTVRIAGYERIPMFKPAVHVRHKYRYQANEAAANLPITDQSLMTSAGVIIRTNGAPGVCNLVFCAIKVHSVELWAPASAAGSFVSLKWAGSGAGANTLPLEVSDTTLSTSAMAHVRGVPPKTSMAHFWRYVNGTLTLPSGQLTLFQVFAPALTIMDVDMEIVMNDNDGVLSDNITTAVTPVGSVVYLTADDFSTTGTFDAVSVATPLFLDAFELNPKRPEKRDVNGKITREFREWQEQRFYRKEFTPLPPTILSLEERIKKLERRNSF